MESTEMLSNFDLLQGAIVDKLRPIGLFRRTGRPKPRERPDIVDDGVLEKQVFETASLHCQGRVDDGAERAKASAARDEVDEAAERG